ncbi:MAG: inositol-3-phosphate synthase [Planctomycetota bacterium]|jgi:myo-inositol-1-phosphate synthase|nr:inositol-3-phosphate synthase [Planctomycetota bacterium]MDP6941162.1 inositol-3-phosphate synthase [Planctomycetota bacterium]
MSPDPRKLGLFLVGARGAIATTVLHGLEALRSGVSPIGMVTAIPDFDSVPFPPTTSFRVRGWDIAGDCHQTASELVRTGVLSSDMTDLCANLRDRLEMSIAPGIAEAKDAELVSPEVRDRLAMTLPQRVSALREDMRVWMDEEPFADGVVVYLATAERSSEVPEEWQNPEANPFELLEGSPADLSPSILYGLAAVAEGLPFVNFTPAPGPQVPALAGYAAREGVPVLGNDGKTGETLLKTVLAPMFRDRGLNVMAWEGYNMLGNRDGAALSNPERREGKLKNKDQVLGSILGPGQRHTGVSIDFVPSLHDWKTAWDFIHFEGFLGTQMSLQFTWQGCDSALAAPLVLDLARIALLAKSRGEGGPLRAASPFFKAPLATRVHDFHRQMDNFRRWVSDSEVYSGD